MTQTVEGLWWKHTAKTGGLLRLSNVAREAITEVAERAAELAERSIFVPSARSISPRILTRPPAHPSPPGGAG